MIEDVRNSPETDDRSWRNAIAAQLEREVSSEVFHVGRELLVRYWLPCAKYAFRIIDRQLQDGEGRVGGGALVESLKVSLVGRH